MSRYANIQLGSLHKNFLAASALANVVHARPPRLHGVSATRLAVGINRCLVISRNSDAQFTTSIAITSSRTRRGICCWCLCRWLLCGWLCVSAIPRRVFGSGLRRLCRGHGSFRRGCLRGWGLCGGSFCCRSLRGGGLRRRSFRCHSLGCHRCLSSSFRSLRLVSAVAQIVNVARPPGLSVGAWSASGVVSGLRVTCVVFATAAS